MKENELKAGKFYVIEDCPAGAGDLNIVSGPNDRTNEAIENFIQDGGWETGKAYTVIRATRHFHVETKVTTKVVND